MAMTITNADYVNIADEVMNSLKNRRLTTSQIRKLLSMTANIYNALKQKNTDEEDSDELSQDILNQIQYLKLHVVYEAGRSTVKGDVYAFIEKAKLIDNIDGIGNKKKNLILFCHYMEALVAYHRFYGGRDQ